MPYRYLIYTLFFASGISGLMYEVVWLRMLARITGVTIYATATVVSAFMAGLALGSFALGRFIDKRSDPLRIYAALELLVAGAALLVPVVFSASAPLYRYVYQVSGESAAATAVVRAVVSFLSVLIPTTVMGGTLPVLTSCLVRRDRLFGRNISMLYGVNTLGAVCGVLLSGFITIGALGEQNTVYIGVTVNLLVAGIAYLVYRLDPVSRSSEVTSKPALPQTDPRISPYSDTIRTVVLVAFAISGFTSLAYEVIWTRQLILFLKTSIYAFSGMLAIFLAGIALGSMCMNRLVDRLAWPLAAFGLLEVLIGVLSLVNLHLFYPLDSAWMRVSLGSALPACAAVIVVFPITFLLGIIFPVAGLCYAKNIKTTGASVGWLYGANTVGSILGSLAAGFFLIPVWGSTSTVIFLACVNAVLGVALVALEPGTSFTRRLVLVPVVIVFGLLTVGSLGKDPFLSTIERRIYGPDHATGSKEAFAQRGAGIHSHREGLEGTVTAFTMNHQKQLWINGIGMTHLCTETKLMAHLPLMFAKNPKDFLVICFGMGTTIKSAALYPNLTITAVELVAEVFDDFSYFHPLATDVIRDPRIKLINSDGRNYLLLSPRTFDVITVDPAPPIWSAGTVNLYSKEFFELCRQHLNPGGVMCLWFPGGTEEEDRSIITTFAEVFPESSFWNGPHKWGFYCIGTLREVPWSEVRTNAEKAFADPAIVRDLVEYDQSVARPKQLYDLFTIDKHRAAEIGKSGIAITDDYPYTEFFLWREWLR
jgi:spermidine synthase